LHMLNVKIVEYNQRSNKQFGKITRVFHYTGGNGKQHFVAYVSRNKEGILEENPGFVDVLPAEEKSDDGELEKLRAENARLKKGIKRPEFKPDTLSRSARSYNAMLNEQEAQDKDESITFHELKLLSALADNTNIPSLLKNQKLKNIRCRRGGKTNKSCVSGTSKRAIKIEYADMSRRVIKRIQFNNDVWCYAAGMTISHHINPKYGAYLIISRPKQQQGGENVDANLLAKPDEEVTQIYYNHASYSAYQVLNSLYLLLQLKKIPSLAQNPELLRAIEELKEHPKIPTTEGAQMLRARRRRMAQREFSDRRDSPVMVRLLEEIMDAQDN